MVRTQVYLTEIQRNELLSLSETLGKKQSELIREAVDRYIDQVGDDKRKAILQEAAGLWKEREDLSDFEALRKEWDRQ